MIVENGSLYKISSLVEAGKSSLSTHILRGCGERPVSGVVQRDSDGGAGFASTKKAGPVCVLFRLDTTLLSFNLPYSLRSCSRLE